MTGRAGGGAGSPQSRRKFLFLKAVAATIVFPGTVTGLIPWLLLRAEGLPPLRSGLLAGSGLAIAGAGLVGLLWCIIEFARIGKGTLAPIAPPKKIVAQGLYRYTRNPMYLAVLTILIGEAILFRSLALAVWAFLVGIGFHVVVIKFEEPLLHRDHGAEYAHFTRTVPRWLPRFRHRP